MKSLKKFLSGISFVVRSILTKPMNKLVYFLSGFSKRNKKIWLVGAQKQSFFCNPKHFFLYVSTHKNQHVRCVWVSRSKEVVDDIKEMGHEAVMLPSIKGWFLCLRASIYMVNCSAKDIGFYLSKGAFFINLWHGIPLKKIQNENKLTNRPSRNIPNGGWWGSFNSIFNPKKVFNYDYVLSPSSYVSQYSFVNAFSVPRSRCIEVGYPRNDILLMGKEDLNSYIYKYDKGVFDLFNNVGEKRIYLYAPTWRDTEKDFVLESGINFNDLDKKLKKENSVLLLKLHPNTKLSLSSINGLGNIIVVPRNFDLYPLLAKTDILITDYSSIYFDFLICDRKIIFFPFDLNSYMSNCRDLYFDYEDVTPGVKAFDYNALCKAMFSDEGDHWVLERQQLRKQFWEDYNGGASERLASFICDNIF